MKNKKYFISIIAVLIIFTLACSLIPTGASTATPEEPAAPAPTQAPPDSVAPPEAPTQDPDSSCEGIVVNGACSEKPFQNPETARCFDYDETGIETTVTYQFTLTSGRLVIDAESVEGQFSNGGLLVVDQKGDHTFTVHNGAYCWTPPEHAEWAYAHRLSVLQQFVPTPTIITIP